MWQSRISLCFLLLVLMPGTALAEVPRLLHYQGYLTNAVGDPVDCPDTLQCDLSYDLIFRLYATSGSETALWEESHLSVPIYQGVFQTILGEQTLLGDDEVGVSRWLGVSVNGNEEMTPRQELASAAFALVSGRADQANEATNANQLGGLDPAEYANSTIVEQLQNEVSNLASTSLGSLTCATGMVAKATPTGWVCDNDQTGNLSSVNSSIEDLQANLDATLTSLNTLEANLANLETSVGSQISNLSDLQTSLSGLQDALTSVQNDITVLQATDGAMQANIDSLQGDVDTVAANLTALDASLSPIAKSGLPADLADGDNDSLADLLCADGEIVRRVGTNWVCGADEGGAVGSTEPAPCDATAVGQMYLDLATNALRICDGTEYQKIKICKELCPPASAVVCGAPITDDCGASCSGTGTALDATQCNATASLCGAVVYDTCGNTCAETGTQLNTLQCDDLSTACGTPTIDDCGNVCGTTGSLCGPTSTCSSGSCVASSSCKDVLDGGLSTGDGLYEVHLNGDVTSPPTTVYCNMTEDGGGWTLVVNWKSSSGAPGPWGYTLSGIPVLNGPFSLNFAEVMPIPSQIMMKYKGDGSDLTWNVSGSTWESSGFNTRILVTSDGYFLFDAVGASESAFCANSNVYDGGYHCDGNDGQIEGRGLFHSSTYDEFCNCNSFGWKTQAGGCTAAICAPGDYFAVYFR